MSITYKDIKKYRLICAEIDSIAAKLERDKRHVVDAVQTAADFPYWLHTIPVEGDVYDYDTKPFRNRMAVLKKSKHDIERFVAEITDYKVQRLVYLFYMAPANGEKTTWERVADEIGDGSTGNACKQLVWWYFNCKSNESNASNNSMC